MVIEDSKERLSRFLKNDREFALTLLNSIHNLFVMTELEAAKQAKILNLLFLGMHSVMQTVSEKIFGLKGPDATKFYLEQFVDGDSTDRKFSLIANDIHEMRNVFAHQWFSLSLYRITLDESSKTGWSQANGEITINPMIYYDQFIAGFNSGGSIWRWQQHINDLDLKIQKYKFVCDFVDIDRGKKTSIGQAIDELATINSSQIPEHEKKIQGLIQSKG